MQQWLLLPFIAAMITSVPAKAQSSVVQLQTRSSGCNPYGQQTCYSNVLDVGGGSDLSTYSVNAVYGDFGGFWTQCNTSASFGRVRISVAKAGYSYVQGGSAFCSAYAATHDYLVAGAPNVANGMPITYTAKATLATSTPVDELYGKVTACIQVDSQQTCTNVPGPITLRVKTTAGKKLHIILIVDSFARADKGSAPLMSASTDKVVRLTLAANKPGANLTGESGYTYK